MASTNEMLNDVSNKVALQSFILSRELTQLNSSDIYNIAAEMEKSIATLLVVANKMKKEAA
jgi:hypothetical protein